VNNIDDLLAHFLIKNFEAVAIYTKHGKKLINESVTVDSGCYARRKAIKIRACVEGRTDPQYFFISDLSADNGKKEIQDVIDANRETHRR
jgi:hypothetical protein